MQAQAVAGLHWCRIWPLPARCVQSGLEMHRKEQRMATLTLTLLNFNTTNKEGQKLWVYQRKV